jgi:hypothetical protein
MSTILYKGDPEELKKWEKLAGPEGLLSSIILHQYFFKCCSGEKTVDDFYRILEGFGGCVDYPGAMFAEDLYEAYPDAKFTLVRSIVNTVRTLTDYL